MSSRSPSPEHNRGEARNQRTSDSHLRNQIILPVLGTLGGLSLQERNKAVSALRASPIG